MGGGDLVLVEPRIITGTHSATVPAAAAAASRNDSRKQ